MVSACSDDDSESGSTNPQGAGSSSDLVGGISDPEKAPFDTVVVLMMENRSFDHLLGWMPGVDGKQAGLSFPAPRAAMVPTAALGNDTQACALKDPAHGWESMATHYNGGKCDGWLQTQTTGDHFPIGYYEAAQVPILAALAQKYTLFDQYHCSVLGATWPNRFYQLCAATDVDETDLFPRRGRSDRRSWSRHLRPATSGRSDRWVLHVGRTDDRIVRVEEVRRDHLSEGSVLHPGPGRHACPT